MKFAIFFVGLMILFLSCNRVTSSEILVDRREHFDTISLGYVHRKVFILSNPTKDTVFIEKITNSCECIQVLNKSRVKYISPKEKDSLIVLLTPLDRGYISRGVTIFFKDKQEPVDLIIEGYVK